MKHPANKPEQQRIFRRAADRDMKFEEVTAKPWTPKPLTKAAAVFVLGMVAGAGVKTAFDNSAADCVINNEGGVHIVQHDGTIRNEVEDSMFENAETGTCETKTFSFKSLEVVNDEVEANPHQYKWKPEVVGMR